jgi:hypothetical protein
MLSLEGASADGLPNGTPLESFTLNDLPTWAFSSTEPADCGGTHLGSPCVIEPSQIVKSTKPVTLLKGTEYWVVAGPNGGSIMGWNGNLKGEMGLASKNPPRGFVQVPGQSPGFAVLGTPVLIDENFDELTPTTPVSGMVGPFFTGTEVGIAGPGVAPLRCQPPTSGDCAWLNGVRGVLTSIPVTLEPGVDYHLSFDMIGNRNAPSDSTTTVTLGSLYDKTFTLAPTDTTTGIVTDQLITVPVATTADLIFKAGGPGNPGNGAVIDNILLTSAVPEPATLGLLALGLLGGAGAGFARRKRTN